MPLVIVWLLLMVAAFYLLLWRPQQRRMSMVRALQTQLKQLRGLCPATQSTQECGILQGLAEVGDVDPRNLGSHGGGSR